MVNAGGLKAVHGFIFSVTYVCKRNYTRYEIVRRLRKISKPWRFLPTAFSNHARILLRTSPRMRVETRLPFDQLKTLPPLNGGGHNTRDQGGRPLFRGFTELLYERIYYVHEQGMFDLPLVLLPPPSNYRSTRH